MLLEEMYALPGSSYEGFDAVGLFWSMTKDSKQIAKLPKRSVSTSIPPQSFKLQLFLDGHGLVDETKFTVGESVETLFFPSANHPSRIVGALMGAGSLDKIKNRPTIIVAGGSEGGIDLITGALLVSEKFNVL